MNRTELRNERQVDFKRYNTYELALLMAEVSKEMQYRQNVAGKALSRADKQRDTIYHTIESTTPTTTEQSLLYQQLQKALRYRRCVKQDIDVLHTFVGTALELNKVGNAMDKIIPKIERAKGNLHEWYDEGKVPQYTRVYRALYLDEAEVESKKPTLPTTGDIINTLSTKFPERAEPVEPAETKDNQWGTTCPL